MEKMLEYIDALMRYQKEFMESWVKSQKEFMENWIAATGKIQESLLSMGLTQEGPAKELLTQYKTWITKMEDSSKVLTDEAGKVQETWKNTIEKQMDMSREMMKNFSGLFKKAA